MVFFLYGPVAVSLAPGSTQFQGTPRSGFISSHGGCLRSGFLLRKEEQARGRIWSSLLR